MKKRQGRVTDKQHEIFLDFMSERPDFVQGKFNSHFTKTISDNLWKELTKKLNSCGFGPAKDVEKWKKTWTDWKCLVKAKAARIQRNSMGDSIIPKESLSVLEERLLSVVDWLNPTPLDTELTVVSVSEENSQYQSESNNGNGELILKTSTEEYVVLEDNDDNLEVEGDSCTASASGNTNNAEEELGTTCEALLYSTTRPLTLGPAYTLKGVKEINSSDKVKQVRRVAAYVQQPQQGYSSQHNERINNAEYSRKRKRTETYQETENGQEYQEENYLEREKVNALDAIGNALHRIADAEESKAATYRDLVIAEQAKATSLQNLFSMAFNYLNRQQNKNS